MNNELYQSYIENIKTKINQKNQTLFNITPLDKIYTNSFNPKHHKDDTMQLQNLLWKQKTIEYRKLQKKINSNKNYKEKEYTIVEDEESLLDIINKNSYKKSWNRLDMFQKKTKIKEYVEHLFAIEKINKLTKDTILQQIPIIIKKGTGKKIQYNNIDSIESIWCITIDSISNTYTFIF
jgi:hypothetical protein|tara:strand:+ start:451 stop:987 length:537 start_codon:yes stop_codon:yes gene_type:complete